MEVRYEPDPETRTVLRRSVVRLPRLSLRHRRREGCRYRPADADPRRRLLGADCRRRDHRRRCAQTGLALTMVYNWTVGGIVWTVIIPSGFPRIAAATTYGSTSRFGPNYSP